VAANPSHSLALWMKLSGSHRCQEDMQGEMLPVSVFSQNSSSPLMVAGAVARLSSPEESRYVCCQNESTINALYCWESEMLEMVSQVPPSQT